MAKTANDQVNPKNKGILSPILTPLGIGFKTLSYVIVATLLAILVEWICMSFWWPSNHAEKTMSTELVYLGENFSVAITGHAPAELAFSVAAATKSFLTENWLITTLTRMANQPNSSRAASVIGASLRSAAEYFEAALFVCMTVSIRVLIILFSSLLMILVAAVTAVDGLIERELRFFGGDREHSRVVHMALYWAPKVTFFAPIAYLAWPDVANPVYFFVPAACAFGYCNYTLISKYQQRL